MLENLPKMLSGISKKSSLLCPSTSRLCLKLYASIVYFSYCIRLPGNLKAESKKVAISNARQENSFDCGFN